MLLLFWKALGLIAGVPADIRWYHPSTHPPRCLIPGEIGLSVVNPYLYYESTECSYAVLEKQCVASDVYQSDVIIGTQSDGLFSLPWSVVQNAGCIVDGPMDLSSGVGTFTTFSGLLSQNIISIEANGDHLAVVTNSGVCYGKQGEGSYYNYASSSGVDGFVTEGGHLYFAEGNRVLRQGEVSYPLSFQDAYTMGRDINDIWVTNKDGIDTLFVATESGVAVFERDQEFYYGSSNYSQIKAEVGTTINAGHIFAVSDQTVDIINMRNKELENSITYSGGIVVMAIENKRLYSK